MPYYAGENELNLEMDNSPEDSEPSVSDLTSVTTLNPTVATDQSVISDSEVVRKHKAYNHIAKKVIL